jgi:arylformamidase
VLRREDEVEHLSPLRHPAAFSSPIRLAYGDSELPELKRQSREYGAALAQSGANVSLVALPSHKHFSILEELASPAGRLTALALELCTA